MDNGISREPVLMNKIRYLELQLDIEKSKEGLQKSAL